MLKPTSIRWVRNDDDGVDSDDDEVIVYLLHISFKYKSMMVTVIKNIDNYLFNYVCMYLCVCVSLCGCVNIFAIKRSRYSGTIGFN